jgi:hypothetical protein
MSVDARSFNFSTSRWSAARGGVIRIGVPGTSGKRHRGNDVAVPLPGDSPARRAAFFVVSFDICRCAIVVCIFFRLGVGIPAGSPYKEYSTQPLDRDHDHEAHFLIPSEWGSCAERKMPFIATKSRRGRLQRTAAQKVRQLSTLADCAT